MKNLITHITTLVILLTTISLNAQVVNYGKAYLSPGQKFSAVSDFDNKAGAEFINDGEAVFYANFNNDGIYDFYAETGSNFFRGSVMQLITGSETGYFFDVEFDNPTPDLTFGVDGEILIENKAYFTNGIVNTRDFDGKIIFDTQTQAVDTWDGSHVDGPVEKLGSSSFVYPVGDRGIYRPAATGDTSGDNIFKTEYFQKTSALQYPHQNRDLDILEIDYNEYWTVERLHGSGGTQLISFSYDVQTTPPEILAAVPYDGVVIVRWDPDLNRWVNEGGSLNQQAHSITTTVEKLGIFTLALVDIDDIECDVEVYNYVDVTGANNNKFLRIDSECAEITRVQVFNRWGTRVFESEHYSPEGEVFEGYSNARMTLGSSHLPSGTYFYILNYEYFTGTKTRSKETNGFLYLTSD